MFPSVLWCSWLGGRKGIQPVKNWVVGCWRGCLGWGADLHIAQQMPLPLTVSCSNKSRLVLPFLFLPFWYLLTRVVLDKFQQSSKPIVCVCDKMADSLMILYDQFDTIFSTTERVFLPLANLFDDLDEYSMQQLSYRTCKPIHWAGRRWVPTAFASAGLVHFYIGCNMV